MTEPKTIVQVRCIAVTESLRRTGVRCFARVVIENTISIDGLTVRRTERGEYLVTWPSRRDSAGRHHAIVTIFDERTRGDVEHAVLVEAARGGWLDPSRISAVPSTPIKRRGP